ncbi:MAG TPA: SGNH/GDSL hydrolase family protein [Planctomycetota bacterium]|nr:SGNH/GDSL hydrolase family protein [Planctomycetota bacterium]
MWRRLALVLGGLLLCAVLVEAGLRVAARFATLRSRQAAGGARAVVCLGDSNTYGVYLEEEETYPAILRARLRIADSSAEVVNLGVPGRNSREVREEVASAVARYAPVAVAVLVGVNDVWREGGPAAGAVGRLFSSLRLVRAARILLARKGPPEGIVNPGEGGPSFRLEGRGGGDVLVRPRGAGPAAAPSELSERLRGNLAAIARSAREGAATPLFLTYGPEEGRLAEVNAAIRDFAASSGEALVDVSPLAREVARRGWTTEFYFQDFHPRPPGYEMIARLVFDALVRRRLFRGEPIADPLAGLEPAHAIPLAALARDRSDPAVRLTGALADPDSLALEIEDAPGLFFRVLLSFDDPPPWRKPLRAESFRADPVFAQSFGLRELGGSFGADGRARVPLGRLARGSEEVLRGRRLQVAYFVRAHAGDPWVWGPSGTRSFELR